MIRLTPRKGERRPRTGSPTGLRPSISLRALRRGLAALEGAEALGGALGLAKLARLGEARVEIERAASLARNARERELLLERAAACSRPASR